MSTHKTDIDSTFVSLGVGAIDFARYSHVAVDENDDERIIYDENIEGAWIQSNTWFRLSACQ
ncbi:hypothetical protein [Halalkalirubrum salinum]|uniref:hypothetical protein n=1 Tax=Halalkalirubrum salinum TaxID=2563889 RepID=UPI0010FB995C|nr:hypothetical protein [Halalkalirubrum salinum]